MLVIKKQRLLSSLNYDHNRYSTKYVNHFFIKISYLNFSWNNLFMKMTQYCSEMNISNTKIEN